MMPGMPSCREVTLAVAGEELARASLGRRMLVRLHVLICRHCRRYVAQMGALGDAARELAAREGKDVERLRRAVLGFIGRPDAD